MPQKLPITVNKFQIQLKTRSHENSGDPRISLSFKEKVLFRSSNYFESCPFPLNFHSFSKQAPPPTLRVAITVPRSLTILICGTAHIFLMPNPNSYLPSPKSYLSIQSCGSHTSLCIRNIWETFKTHKWPMGLCGAQASFFNLKPKGVHSSQCLKALSCLLSN